MASNKIFEAGPLALTTTTTTNLLNPAAASGGVNGGSSGQYIIVKHVFVVNKTASAANFSLWRGATRANAACTELFRSQNLAANTSSSFYFNPAIRFDTTDFLVGGASANTTLTLSLFGEVGVSG